MIFNKKKKKKVSPKASETILRMWNDLRKSYDLDVTKFKNNQELKDKIYSIDEQYGKYFYENKNPLAIIKSQEITQIRNKEGKAYEGETEKIRTAILGIDRKEVRIEITNDEYIVRGSRGGLLRKLSIEEVEDLHKVRYAKKKRVGKK